tara:strand:+ start:3383 stop:3661 length:279 start_codon:yes stop_codon:yes gene_type:complete
MCYFFNTAKYKIGDVVKYNNSRYGYGIVHRIQTKYIYAFFSGIDGDTWSWNIENINIIKTNEFTKQEVANMFGKWFWEKNNYMNQIRKQLKL